MTAVVSALLIARDKRELFLRIDEVNCEIFQQITAFEKELPPVRTDSAVEKLLTGRQGYADGS